MLDVDVAAANGPADIEPEKRPAHSQSVAIRMKSKSACQPGGDSAIRIGDTLENFSTFCGTEGRG